MIAGPIPSPSRNGAKPRRRRAADGRIRVLCGAAYSDAPYHGQVLRIRSTRVAPSGRLDRYRRRDNDGAAASELDGRPGPFAAMAPRKGSKPSAPLPDDDDQKQGIAGGLEPEGDARHGMPLFDGRASARRDISLNSRVLGWVKKPISETLRRLTQTHANAYCNVCW